MMADIEKVIKGLEYCIADEYCDECPYTDDCFEIDDKPYGEKLLRDVLELLKEQPKIVRCKDCLRRHEPSCPMLDYRTRDLWFCADGERRDDDG